MKVGLITPQGWKMEYEGWDPAEAWANTVALAKQAEELGFESLWAIDHALMCVEYDSSPTGTAGIVSYCSRPTARKNGFRPPSSPPEWIATGGTAAGRIACSTSRVR